MAETFLHDLRRQLKASVNRPVNAPTRKEMAERVQTGILRSLNRMPMRSGFTICFFAASRADSGNGNLDSARKSENSLHSSGLHPMSETR
jgi:hypothetical protein